MAGEMACHARCPGGTRASSCTNLEVRGRCGLPELTTAALPQLPLLQQLYQGRYQQSAEYMLAPHSRSRALASHDSPHPALCCSNRSPAYKRGEREKLRDSPQGHTARDWRVRSRSDIKARPRLRHAETGVKLREAPCHLPGPLPKSRAQAVVGTSTGRGPPGSSRWQRAGEPCRPCQPPITPPKRANCLHHGKSSVATEPFEKLRWRSPGQRRLPRPAAEPGVKWSMKGEFGAIGVDHRRAHKRGTPGCDHTPATARLSSAWHSTAALSLK